MRKLTVMLTVLAVGAGLVAAVASGSSQSAQGMYSIAIKSYKVKKDGTVQVEVKVRGLKMAPKAVGKAVKAGQGHWHMIINGKYNTFSANPTLGTTKKLKKGDYKMYVELVNNDHSSLAEKTRSKTIPVMVGQ